MKLFKIQTIRHLTCIFLGLIFFTSGMSKLFYDHQFVGVIGPVWLEKELAQYGLGLFARFIGYAQVTIGFLLLTIRYSTLGAVMLIPLISNIFMVTVSMNWKGTPYVLAVLLIMNVFVIWTDRKLLLPIVRGSSEAFSGRKQSLNGVLVWLLSFALILISVNISYRILTVAYIIVVGGLLLSILSYRMDRITLLR